MAGSPGILTSPPQTGRLRPDFWSWRAEEFSQYHFGPSRNVWLVAQEVEKVFPEMVSTDASGYKQVNYSELPYLMLQAIRELKAENDALHTNFCRVQVQGSNLQSPARTVRRDYRVQLA